MSWLYCDRMIFELAAGPLHLEVEYFCKENVEH